MNKHYTFIKLFLLFILVSSFSCTSEKKAKILVKKTHLNQDSLAKYPNYLDKNYVQGKFDYTKDSSFVIVPKEHSNKTIYIRKEVLNAFLKMKQEAEKDSIEFTIISGTRSFEYQKQIWDYKWNEKYKDLPPTERVKKILEYSSIPSTSRHHWGTDIDLNSLSNNYFSHGKGIKTYNWLQKNAHKFGFYQVYTSKENGRKGYNEEKWHWSYAPFSSLYLKFYNEKIQSKDFPDFQGADFIKKIKIVNDYVNGINPNLLNYKY